jgi:hypothetical protein
MDDEVNDNSYVNTFIDMMKAAMPDKVITNFVFIAEVVGDKDNELSIITSNAMTPWLAQGMLKAAEDMMLSGVDSFIDEHGEDDQ